MNTLPQPDGPARRRPLRVLRRALPAASWLAPRHRRDGLGGLLAPESGGRRNADDIATLY